MTQTNCPNCGAVITGPKCEYCGTAFEDYKVIATAVCADGEEIVEEYSGIDAITFAKRLSELAAKSGIPMEQVAPIFPDPVAASNSLKMVMQKINDNSAEEKEGEWPILEPYESFNVSLTRTTKGKAFKKIRKQMIKDDRIKRRQARLLKLKNFITQRHSKRVK